MANNINMIIFKAGGKCRRLEEGLGFRGRSGQVVCVLSRFDQLETKEVS